MLRLAVAATMTWLRLPRLRETATQTRWWEIEKGDAAADQIETKAGVDQRHPGIAGDLQARVKPARRRRRAADDVIDGDKHGPGPQLVETRAHLVEVGVLQGQHNLGRLTIGGGQATDQGRTEIVPHKLVARLKGLDHKFAQAFGDGDLLPRSLVFWR